MKTEISLYFFYKKGHASNIIYLTFESTVSFSLETTFKVESGHRKNGDAEDLLVLIQSDSFRTIRRQIRPK